MTTPALPSRRRPIRSGLLLPALTLAFAGVAGGCEKAEPPAPVFIALGSDFAPFRTWDRFSLGDGELAGHPPGPRFGYLNQKAPGGAKAYPVGTIIVKTIEGSADPTSWDLFGMVKRGGGFNAQGAVDWEFFILRISENGTPVIASRGSSPADLNDMGVVNDYAAAAGSIGCNLCHGNASAAHTDYILSAPLQPGAQ